MERQIYQRNSIMVLLMAILIGVLWVGCSTTVKERQGEPAKAEEGGLSKYRPRYYHFDDVLVPAELNFDEKKSFVYEAPQFKTGILYFSKWWLDVNSLIDFFTFHMEKDNWKVVNSYRGKVSILNFSKPEKSCTIAIAEGWTGTTEVEIRVGPVGGKKM